jgi:uncharacterized protein YcfL
MPWNDSDLTTVFRSLSLFMLCGCIASSKPSLMNGYKYPVFVERSLESCSTNNQDHIINYIIKPHTLSHIINHEHISIAFAIIIKVALQRVLRVPLTAKLSKWKH